jgi:hypothetical protein
MLVDVGRERLEVDMRIFRLGVLLALAVAAASCNKSPTVPSETRLVGTWTATKAEFVLAANPAVKVDVVAQGSRIVLVLDSAGTYTLTITDPAPAIPFVNTGTWSSDEESLILAWMEQEQTRTLEFRMSLNLTGTVMTATGGRIRFDVDGDHAEDDAILSLTMVRP